MKNTLKRILLLLPVISVLLVALAVPAFADYSSETGWSEPVGTFEPIYNVSMSYFYTDGVFRESVVGNIGAPFEFNGVEVFFKYKLVITPKPDSGLSSTWIYDNTNGYCLAVNEASEDNKYILGDVIRGQSPIAMQIHTLEGNDFSLDVVPCVFYLTDYPFSGDYERLADFNFEVYEVVSPPSSDSVTSVWTEIMTWITSAFNSVMGAFYVDGSLTLLGTLAVIGVSVGIGFLLIGIIQRFLKLRG